jgi:phage N-6-adenine-methyltransferase
VINLDNIRLDGGTQPRAQLDWTAIASYTEDMQNGDTFPPIVAYYDGADYWLVDGFHRVRAAQQAGLTEIAADVRQGSLQEAQWHSYGVNATHGLRRSNDDKRRAVEAALRHEYASRCSNREIARHCGVGSRTVDNYRREMEATAQIAQSDRRIGADGRTINTANIGKTPAAEVSAPQQAAPAQWKATQHTGSTSIAQDEPGLADEPLTPYEAGLMGQMQDGAPDPVVIDPMCKTTPVSELPDYDGDEWYTPAYLIDAARCAMGGIDLDPASNPAAQDVVQASMYYTKDQDGLAQEWHGRIWMNPPYSCPQDFTRKLTEEYQAGRLQQAVVLVNNCTETEWFHDFARYASVLCLLRRRAAFWYPGRRDFGARQGQVVFGVGVNIDQFVKVFSGLGIVLKDVTYAEQSSIASELHAVIA